MFRDLSKPLGHQLDEAFAKISSDPRLTQGVAFAMSFQNRAKAYTDMVLNSFWGTLQAANKEEIDRLHQRIDVLETQLAEFQSQQRSTTAQMADD